MFKIIRLILYIVFITYFVGQYWMIFVEIISLGYHTHNGVEMKQFGEDETWALGTDSRYERTIAAMYFAMTSLSTVGFGDLHPCNDYERLLGSVMLLGGVSCFSLVLNELSYMISNIKFLNGEIEYKDELEQFFIMLSKFNFGAPMDFDL